MANSKLEHAVPYATRVLTALKAGPNTMMPNPCVLGGLHHRHVAFVVLGDYHFEGLDRHGNAFEPGDTLNTLAKLSGPR